MLDVLAISDPWLTKTQSLLSGGVPSNSPGMTNGAGVVTVPHGGGVFEKKYCTPPLFFYLHLGAENEAATTRSQSETILCLNISTGSPAKTMCTTKRLLQ